MEEDLERYAEARRFPIIPCDLCGSQETLQRKQVKALLRDWEKRFPGRIETLARSVQNVVPSHLADRALYDFAGLHPSGEPLPDGDRAFDADDMTAA